MSLLVVVFCVFGELAKNHRTNEEVEIGECSLFAGASVSAVGRFGAYELFVESFFPVGSFFGVLELLLGLETCLPKTVDCCLFGRSSRAYFSVAGFLYDVRLKWSFVSRSAFGKAIVFLPIDDLCILAEPSVQGAKRSF